MINDLDINNIRDFNDAIDCIHKLLNLVETLSQENRELKRQNQELRDEINRLKERRQANYYSGSAGLFLFLPNPLAGSI